MGDKNESEWIVVVALSAAEAMSRRGLVASLARLGLLTIKRVANDGGLKLGVAAPFGADSRAWAIDAAHRLRESGMRAAAIPLVIAEVARTPRRR